MFLKVLNVYITMNWSARYRFSFDLKIDVSALWNELP